MNDDIRWKQRFQNFNKALVTLKNAAELAAERDLSDLEEQGMSGIIGSKNAIRQAFNSGLIEDGDIWIEMVESRNLASHSYDEETADKIFAAIINTYYDKFLKLASKLNTLA